MLQASWPITMPTPSAIPNIDASEIYALIGDHFLKIEASFDLGCPRMRDE